MLKLGIIMALLQRVVFILGQQQQQNTGCFFDASILLPSIEFCVGLERHVLLGDFNGNGKFNILCHDDRTGQMSLFNLKSSSSVNIAQQFCLGAPLYAIAINGDKRYDLFCVQQNKTIKYILNDETGTFDNITIKEVSYDFCNHYNDTFLTGDLDNDGRSDIVCHHKDGNISYAYSNRNGFGDIQTFHADWCKLEEDKLLMGDFNNDDRSDLLCHSPSTGEVSIRIFTETGVFSAEVWRKIVPLCKDVSSFLLVSDINGDGNDDLICKEKTKRGLTTIIRNQQPSNYFTNSLTENNFGFCSNGGKRNFFSADFDGDGLNDLMCQTYTGKRRILLRVSGSGCY